MLENVNLTQSEAIGKTSLYLDCTHSILATLVAYQHKHEEVHVKPDTRDGSLGE